MPLVIEVTYGTREHQVYATVPDLANGDVDNVTANALKVGAKERGYSDARIINEKDFRQAQDDYRNRATSSRPTYRRAG